jgi:hypothetical protein
MLERVTRFAPDLATARPAAEDMLAAMSRSDENRSIREVHAGFERRADADTRL